MKKVGQQQPAKRKKKPKYLLFFLIALFLQVQGETLVGIQATVEPSTVNAQNTKLRLFGSIVTELTKGDYFLLTLPSQVKVKYSASGENKLNCVFNEPFEAPTDACESINSQQIKLTVGSSNVTNYFQFDVFSALQNPPSATFTDSVVLETFRGETKLDFQTQGILIAATNDSLSSLTMQGTVSQFAGDKNTLQFQMRTKNTVLPNGLVQVQFPFWFQVTRENIRLSHIADRNALNCMDLSAEGNPVPTQCSFDTRTQTVTLSGMIGASGKPSGSVLLFTIKNILNPISTDISPTLTVRTADQLGGVIDQAEIGFRASLPNQITNSLFYGDSSMVQEATRYTLQFSINVPMYQSACTVAIYLPYPDFKLTSATSSITDVQGIGLFGAFRSYQYQVNPTDNSITIKDACNLGPILPTIPATIYILGLKNPEVAKFTDPIRIKIWNAQNGEVAELTTAKSPTFQITVGSVTGVSMVIAQNKINSVLDFTVKFQFQQSASVSSTDSQSQNARIEFAFTDQDFKIQQNVTVLSTNVPGQSLYVESFNLTENKITVLVQSPQIKSGMPYQIQFSGMKLAGSRQKMGPLVIQLSKQSFNNGMLQYYPVNNGSFSELIETTEGKFLRADIYPSSLKVYEETTYRFQMAIENPIPQKGYILITIPQDIFVDGGSPICQYQGKPTSCSLDPTMQGGRGILITGPFVTQAVTPEEEPVISVEVLNIRNPRSTKTTGIFTFHSFDQLGNLIDYYTESNTAVTMTEPALITDARVKEVSSLRVRDLGVEYKFEIKLAMPLNQGDYILLGMPDTGEISLPQQPLSKCYSPQQSGLVCSLSNDKQLKFTLSNSLMPNQALNLELSNFTNPANGRPTGSFKLAVFDALDFEIAVTQANSSKELSVQMTLPFIITTNATLRTNTDITTAPIVITIQMFMRNVIPASSKLIITYPSDLKTPSELELSVLSPQTSSLNGVIVNLSTRQIVGDAFFSVQRPENSYLELQITGFRNPSNAKRTGDFVVEVQTPEGFVIDRVQQSSLDLKSRCDYPCKDCMRGSSICDSCLAPELTKLTLLEENKCVENCRAGFYQIGNLCGKCDSNCRTCDISPLLCTSCDSNMYLFNNRCVSTCDSGYFRNDIEKICEQCQTPCLSCQNSINTCTTCQSGYFLYRGTCRQSCPEDYFINNPSTWNCDRCVNECQTCQRTIDQCTSCKPSYRLNTLNSTCFQGQCPANITVEETEGVCSPCKSKCATCANNNTGYCTMCSPGLHMTDDNDCLVNCKPGTAIKLVDSVSRCVNCPKNCSKCNDGTPEVCIQCEEGFVNFKFSQCLIECPFGYDVNNKSGNCIDSTKRCKFGYGLNAKDECELEVQYCEAGYVLNEVLNKCIPVPGLYIPFPFLIFITISTLILIWRIKKSNAHKTTRLIPTIIIYWSFFEVPLFLVQIAFAAQFEHWFNVAITFIGVIFHFFLNCYSVRSILPEKLLGHRPQKGNDREKLKVDNVAGDMQPEIDQIFKYWAVDHLAFLWKLRRWSLYYNHKLLRLLTSSYLGKAQYQAVFDNHEERVTRPFLRVAIANMTFTYLLIAIGDVTALKQIVVWGYQFTVLCIETFLFVSAMAILEVADYYVYRNKDNGAYFKVNARNIDGNDSNVFKANGDDTDGNYRLRRQKSQDRHVKILKQLNDELFNRKVYLGNFDKLSHYCNEHELYHSPLKGKTVIRSDKSCADAYVQSALFEEGRTPSARSAASQESDVTGKCLSTQGHYRWNKIKFWDYDKADQRQYRSEGEVSEAEWNESEWERPFNSLISETEYGDPQRLNMFREEFPYHGDRLETPPPPEEEVKTLDYKASFHILDKHQNSDDDDLYIVQQPPKFNLTDVMGHFETDLRGNFVLIKKTVPTIEGGLDEYLVDALGRRVNRRGYLVDKMGNIISKFAEIVVTRDQVDPETDDIPAELFAELFIPKQITRNIELISGVLGSQLPPQQRRKRVMTGKLRQPSSNLLLNNQIDSGAFLTKSRDTAHYSRLKRNIMTDGDDQLISIEIDDTDAYSGSRLRKKNKKSKKSKERYSSVPEDIQNVPLKRPKVSREQQLLGGAGTSSKNLLNIHSNEDLMNEIASDSDGGGFQINLNHAKGIFDQQHLKKKGQKKKKTVSIPQSKITVLDQVRLGERALSPNGFTVYGGNRTKQNQSTQEMSRPGSNNRLIVKDGQVLKESRLKSKPRVPAFVRPQPQQMLKKQKPEIPRILAQSPELPEVEMYNDVKILDPVPDLLEESTIHNNADPTDIISSHDNLNQVSQNQNLELKKQTSSQNNNDQNDDLRSQIEAKQKMIHELENQSNLKDPLDKIIEQITQPKQPKARAFSNQRPPIKKKIVPKKPVNPLDGGLYRIHLDIEDENSINQTRVPISGAMTPGLNDTAQSLVMNRMDRPLFNPTSGFLDQSQASLEATRRDLNHQRFQQRYQEQNTSQHNLLNSSMEQLIAPGRSTAFNSSGRLILNRDHSNERQNMIHGHIGTDKQYPTNQIDIKQLMNQSQVGINQQYFYHGGRSTSLISPMSNATMSISNDQALIVHDGQRVPKHQTAQQLNKVSSAYKQNLTLLMKQTNNNRSGSREGGVRDGNDAYAQLKKIFNQK